MISIDQWNVIKEYKFEDSLPSAHKIFFIQNPVQPTIVINHADLETITFIAGVTDKVAPGNYVDLLFTGNSGSMQSRDTFSSHGDYVFGWLKFTLNSLQTIIEKSSTSEGIEDFMKGGLITVIEEVEKGERPMGIINIQDPNDLFRVPVKLDASSDSYNEHPSHANGGFYLWNMLGSVGIEDDSLEGYIIIYDEYKNRNSIINLLKGR